MPQELKKGRISFDGASPMALSEISGAADSKPPTSEQQDLLRAVGGTIAAYTKAGKELLSGRLSHLKRWAPPHLAEPGNVVVACCSGGVVVRFETKSESESDRPSKRIAAWVDGSLIEVASLVSQSLIRIRRDEAETQTPDDAGTEIRLLKISADRSESTVLASGRITFDAVLTNQSVETSPASKPFCLLSVRNSLEFQLVGEILPIEPDCGPGQPFMARSLLRLPVGWDCIEVFPSAVAADWQLEYARGWVEKDLLAAVVSSQFQEAQLNSLDHGAEARRHFAGLLEEFRELIDSDPQREEVLQRFLAANPAILCPTHTRVWPKLALGGKVTDFVFQEAAGDYLLVELEKSIDPLFTKSGHQSQKLNHARGQIQDWRRYLEDNLNTVQRELGLQGISSSPQCLIVIGRANTLSTENRRKLAAIENEAPRLKVLTYDDVLDNAKAVVENLLGPLWNVKSNTRIYYLPPGSIAREA